MRERAVKEHHQRQRAEVFNNLITLFAAGQPFYKAARTIAAHCDSSDQMLQQIKNGARDLTSSQCETLVRAAVAKKGGNSIMDKLIGKLSETIVLLGPLTEAEEERVIREYPPDEDDAPEPEEVSAPAAASPRGDSLRVLMKTPTGITGVELSPGIRIELTVGGETKSALKVVPLATEE